MYLSFNQKHQHNQALAWRPSEHTDRNIELLNHRFFSEPSKLRESFMLLRPGHTSLDNENENDNVKNARPQLDE